MVAAVLSSCSLPTATARPNRVDVDTLETDILFGAQASPAPAPSPTGTTALLPPIEPLAQPSPLFFTGNPLPPPRPAQSPCPAAPATSFPAQVAESTVTTMPQPGQYRWAGKGGFDQTVLTITFTTSLPQFETRYVRNPAAFTDPIPAAPGSPTSFNFTFETIEPHLGTSDSYLMYWQVKANSQTPNDPEAGLVLKQVDTLDKDAKITGTIFKPVTGLLLLPLPVSPGAAITSTAVDTSAGANSLQYSGTVGSHERVDACGEPVQAWGVDGTLTPTGASSGNPAKVHYDVATQMGALVVAFNVDGGLFGTTFHKAETRIGQLKADPLPAKYK
jgi:hypothetical protein